MSSDPKWIPTPFASREEHVQHLARVMRDRAYPEFSHAPTPLWANDAAEAILSEFERLYRVARNEATETDERQPVTAAGRRKRRYPLFYQPSRDVSAELGLRDASAASSPIETSGPAASGDALRAVAEEVAQALDGMAVGFEKQDADQRPESMGPGLHPITQLLVNDLRGKAKRLRDAAASPPLPEGLDSIIARAMAYQQTGYEWDAISPESRNVWLVEARNFLARLSGKEEA